MQFLSEGRAKDPRFVMSWFFLVLLDDVSPSPVICFHFYPIASQYPSSDGDGYLMHDGTVVIAQMPGACRLP